MISRFSAADFFGFIGARAAAVSKGGKQVKAVLFLKKKNQKNFYSWRLVHRNKSLFASFSSEKEES
jgi:hypothetical protein